MHPRPIPGTLRGVFPGPTMAPIPPQRPSRDRRGGGAVVVTGGPGLPSTPHTVEPAEAGQRLDKWLAAPSRLGSRTRALDALRKGRVFLDGREASVADAGLGLAAGQQVDLWLDRPGSASQRGPRRVHGLDIVLEDDTVLVVCKPAGLPTVPVPDRAGRLALVDLVARHWRAHGKRRPLVVHRLDADTSGLVVIARSPAAEQHLRGQFASRSPLRRYVAFVLGTPTPAEGTWRHRLLWDEARRMQRPALALAQGVREAVAHYRVVETYGEASRIEVDLETGRQHQIRVQAMLQGHPLLGERLYVGVGGARLGRMHPRQALHAQRLCFEHPRSHRPVDLVAPLPDDLVALRRRLARDGLTT